MISRRNFARDLAVVVLLAPIHASADTARKLRRIGLLSPDSRPTDAELQDTWVPLRKHGWIEGTDFVPEYRFAEGRKDLLARLSGNSSDST